MIYFQFMLNKLYVGKFEKKILMLLDTLTNRLENKKIH